MNNIFDNQPLAPAEAAALPILLAALAEVNGQDAYSTAATALGKLRRTEYLVLPLGVALAIVPIAEVGTLTSASLNDAQYLANVYALNKAIAPVGSNAVLFGLIRMQAVAHGWATDQREIRYELPIPDAIAMFAADVTANPAYLADAGVWAFLTPIIAEGVFRTTGHHYLTGQAADYDRKYEAVWRASLTPSPVPSFAPGVIYHTALHWVGPARARLVLEALIGTDRIPNAIAIRSNAAPAGTAVVTTSAAVIDAFQASDLHGLLAAHVGADMTIVTTAAAAIRADPVAYHVTQVAYNRPARPPAIVAELEAAAAAAARIAWLTQGFINAMLGDAALSRAMALRKHAENNPMGLKRAERFFRLLAKKSVDNVDALFSADVGA